MWKGGFQSSEENLTSSKKPPGPSLASLLDGIHLCVAARVSPDQLGLIRYGFGRIFLSQRVLLKEVQASIIITENLSKLGSKQVPRAPLKTSTARVMKRASLKQLKSNPPALCRMVPACGAPCCERKR